MKIEEEIRRRNILCTAIDAVIDSNYRPQTKSRLKRGAVHEHISRELGIILNNPMYKLILERMSAKGYRPYIARGTQYFENITLRGEGS